MTVAPLISASLLGSSRMAAFPPASDPSLEKTWDALAGLDSADGLLQALALVRALRLAGVKARPATESGTAGIPEIREPLDRGMVESLTRLLNGEYPGILAEFLDLASASGRVFPGRVLPEILASAIKDPSLRPNVRHLAGERGTWIARHYPMFSWLSGNGEMGDDTWDDGSPSERIAWLRQTRRTDPSRAMAAIASHWAGEDATLREAILTVICENPLATDEAWLERQALSDRLQEIRAMAQAGLMSLPGSGFRKRALERVRNRVTIQRRLLKRVIMVEPPDQFDPSWTADGLKEKPPQGSGEKAWWLRQMISMVPLDEWPSLLDCSPRDLFRLTLDPDWREPLILGWIDAACCMPVRALPDEFVPFLGALDPCPTAEISKVHTIAAVLDVLPSSRRGEVLDQVVGELPVPLALELLVRCAVVPDHGKGRHILKLVDSVVSAVPATITRPQARALALCIPPDGIQPRLESLAKFPELSPIAEEFATTLEFRRSIRSHFILP